MNGLGLRFEVMRGLGRFSLLFLSVLTIVCRGFEGVQAALIGTEPVSVSARPDVSTATATVRNKRPFREGELIIKFKSGVVESRKAQLHKRHGSEKVREFRTTRLQHLRVKKGEIWLRRTTQNATAGAVVLFLLSGHRA